jgi:hypothetical protein
MLEQRLLGSRCQHTHMVPAQVLIWQTIKEIDWGTFLPLSGQDDSSAKRFVKVVYALGCRG